MFAIAFLKLIDGESWALSSGYSGYSGYSEYYMSHIHNHRYRNFLQHFEEYDTILKFLEFDKSTDIFKLFPIFNQQ